jgi:hypothetical protein
MKVKVVEENVLEEGKGFAQRLGLDNVVDNISIKIDDILKDMNKCADVFTEVERAHLEEVLHGDLNGYWEEIKDVDASDADFKAWKNKTLGILKKCNLNEWSTSEFMDNYEEIKKKEEIKIMEEYFKNSDDFKMDCAPIPLKKPNPLREAFQAAAEKERQRKIKIAERK